MTQHQIRVKTSTGWQDLIVAGPSGEQGVEGPTGSQGPTGPQGAPGTGGYEDTFYFNTPSATWDIVHSQGTYAISVETLDINGMPFLGDVSYPDLNTIRVQWFAPQVGQARVYR